MVDGKPLPVAPPWGKGGQPVRKCLGSRWCPWFGQRPRRRGEIAGERRLGHEEDEPNMRVPLSVTHRFPPLFYLYFRFLAILQKSYLQFLSSKFCVDPWDG